MGKQNVVLGRYKGMGYSKPDIVVEAEEVSNYLDLLRKQQTIEKESKNGIKDGDHLMISFSASVDGEPLKELTKQRYHLKTGQGFFYRDFEKELYGRTKGEIFSFDMILPFKNSPKGLEGEEVNFVVELHEVTEEIVPELTDEYVLALGIKDVETINQLEAYASERIYYDKMLKESASIINEVMNQVVESSKVSIDEEDILDLTNDIKSDFIKDLRAKRLDFDVYLNYNKMTETSFVDLCRQEAVGHLTEKYILDAIAEAEDISVPFELLENDIEKEQILYQEVVRFLARHNTSQD